MATATDKRVTQGRFVQTGEFRTVWGCSACGFRGTTGCSIAPDGQEGLWCYKCRERGTKSPLRDVKVPEERWEPGLVEVKCCGTWLACHAFTNTCHRCETDYNGSGQQLSPRHFWGEETGETLGEILSAAE